jgi:arylsulfatase A-like enzyme
VSDLAVSAIDVLPTVLELLDLPAHPAMQGLSFLDEAAWRARAPVLPSRTQGLRFVDGLICWPWQLVLDHTAGERPALHDLDADPWGQVDRYDPADPQSVALLDLLRGTVAAQMRYHNGRGGGDATGHYAPRRLRCPTDTGGPRAR